MKTKEEIGLEFVKHQGVKVKVTSSACKAGKSFIIKLKPASNSIQQAEEFINNLQHHGVKGMHWGVRREQLRTSSALKRGAKETQRRLNRPPSPVKVIDTIGSNKSTKTKLKAVGGEDHPAHEDAIKVAASRQKMKRSGIHTLSNEELQKMSTRMNLEAQVHSLDSRRKKSIGQGFVDAHLAKALKDPFGTVVKAHKISKTARENTGGSVKEHLQTKRNPIGFAPV